MFLNGLLSAGIVALMAWLMYENFKIEVEATANYRGLRMFKKILAADPYFRWARTSLLLHPVAGFLVGVSDGFWMYMALGFYFILLALLAVLFFIGSRAVDAYRRPPRE